ncbi:MAG TPA: saccharopine dehydrogenase NADP-binding domain-containing protein, partial [Anaerolineales bacterium]
SLDETPKLAAALNEAPVVLNCAGPFSHTADRIVTRCLETNTHYIDITGEISVFESLAAKDQAAQQAGVMLLPGAGFDVVPSDCLAAHLKTRLPSADALTLAFRAITRPSQGTLRSSVENIPNGGRVRKAGKLTAVPAAWKRRAFDFGRGPVLATSIPWGDVSTAYFSTGIPNIIVYMAMPAGLHLLLVASRYLGWILRISPVRKLVQGLIGLLAAGPSQSLRLSGASILWAQAEDPAGERVQARLKTPESYALTAQTALSAVRKVLAGQAPPGYATPSSAYGKDFILEFEGVERMDLD